MTPGVARFIYRGWNSPTATTFASFSARFGYGVVVLPIALATLSSAELTLWLLFRSLISMRALATLGLTPTFVRALSYAMAGARAVPVGQGVLSVTTDPSAEPNWSLVGRITTTMRMLYLLIATGALLVLATVGVFLFLEPVQALEHPWVGWSSCALVFAVLSVSLAATSYLAYLEGLNEVARVRRWEALTGLGSIASSAITLLAGGGLLGVVIAEQLWYLFSAVRNRQLCLRVAQGRFRQMNGLQFVRPVFDAVWPPAWRSGLGVLMYTAPLELSGFIYANVSSSAALSATYLFALRVVRMISSLSYAPFHSKIPVISRSWAEGDTERLLRIASLGMQRTYWGFAGIVVLAGAIGPIVLGIIGSSTPFPDQVFWSLLGLSVFAERFGAMHLQLYSATNHIIWHRASGGAGLVFLVVFLSTLPALGEYATPVGLLTGNLGFFSWYAARHSYRAYRLDVTFELATSAPPLLLLLGYLAAAVLIDW